MLLFECPDNLPLDTWSRFLRNCLALDNGCVQWTGGTNGTGYGMFYSNGSRTLAHRQSYIWATGTDISGLDLHHICGNTLCVNPAHLEPLPHRNHVLLAVDPKAARTLPKDRCIRGHLLDSANIRFNKSGERYCIACKNEYRSAWKERDPDGYHAYYREAVKRSRQKKFALVSP